MATTEELKQSIIEGLAKLSLLSDALDETQAEALRKDLEDFDETVWEYVDMVEA